MDPMMAGRKIRMHVELFDKMEFKEGGLHICCDCLNYIEHPILWFRDYRFYPYCITCMKAYFKPIKIDYVYYPLSNRRHDCHGSRT